MKIITICEVCDYGEEGKSPRSVYARFATRKAAEDAFPKRDGRTPLEDVTLVIYESVEDYSENNPTALRRKALAKLNAAEKQALGLKDDV